MSAQQNRVPARGGHDVAVAVRICGRLHVCGHLTIPIECGASVAHDHPARTITLVVPYPPGGGSTRWRAWSPQKYQRCASRS